MAFACTTGFIIYLNKTKKKPQSRLGPQRCDFGYLQEPLSSRAAFHLAASLVNVRAQPRGGALPRSNQKALIGRASSTGIEKQDNSPKKMCRGGAHRVDLPKALLLFSGSSCRSRTYLSFHTQAAAHILVSADESGVWHQA